MQCTHLSFFYFIKLNGLQLMVFCSWKINSWVNEKQLGQEFSLYDPHLLGQYRNRSTCIRFNSRCGTV